MKKSKHDYDKILIRLNDIIHRLYTGECLKPKELAEEYNVSVKTIQRDFSERLYRFPIERDQKNNCWKMKEGCGLEKVHDVEEQLVLDIMEKMTDTIGGKFGTKSKALLSKLKNKTKAPIYTSFFLEDISKKVPEVVMLEKAIIEEKQITFNYRQHNEILTEPLKIVNFDGFWYLMANEVSSNIIKKYYLRDVSGIKLTDSEFEYEYDDFEGRIENALNAWFRPCGDLIEVILSVDASVAKYFKRKPINGTQQITQEDEHGKLILSVKVTSEKEILPIVKYWIPNIDIVSPAKFSELINTELRSYLIKA